MSVIKKPYEISIWEDKLVFVIDRYENNDGVKGNYVDTITTYPDELENPLNYIQEVSAQYYDEIKLAIIGSDTMTAPFRAVVPNLTFEVNGQVTLSFMMYTHYYDDDAEDFVDNPFIKLLINERKIKIKYDGEWYDLIIKTVQENSEARSFTYTAKSLFINELSKTGYQLQFDTELENNLGTVDYLANQILDGSDWRLKQSEIFQQYIEEPVYQVLLDKDITAHIMYKGDKWADYPDTLELSAGTIIYGLYDSVNNISGYFQFLYSADDYVLDDDYVISNSPNYYYEYTPNNGQLPFTSNISISSEYRGRRLVRAARTEYDPLTDKYVSVYKKEGSADTIYGYTEFEYLTTDSVTNYVVNSSAFTSFAGWSPGAAIVNGSTIYPDINLATIPDISEITTENMDFNSYLRLQFTHSNQTVLNSCISENRSLIKNFYEGEKYVFRIKYGTYSGGKLNAVSQSNGLHAKICTYKFKDGTYIFNDADFTSEVYFDFQDSLYENEAGTGATYRKCVAQCTKSLSYSDLLDKKIGLFLTPNTVQTFYIEDIQFFPYRVQSNGNLILPGEIITSEARRKYYYYTAGQQVTSVDDLVYLYAGHEPNSLYTQVYDDTNFEKRRSITASESNRFNLLQTLCETFECWAKFTIEHEENGKVKLDPDTYRQLKWVSFHEYIGKENFLGFKRGINLKSVQHNLDSEPIATKLIVKNNSNEFADGGFCSISTAEENPIKENFLLDFSYYIQHGLLNFNELNNDLYLTNAGYIGYYTQLRELNKRVEENSLLQAELISKTIPHLNSQLTSYEVTYESANEIYRNTKLELEAATGKTIEYFLANKGDSWWRDKDINALIVIILQQKKNLDEYQRLRDVADYALNSEDPNNPGANVKLKLLKDEIEDITNKKRELNAKFYQKYSRFIQEGAWISEDYIDDNLYYLDSVSTLHTSAQPKVTYTINVIDVSGLEGLELYSFKIGDKTTMEDIEFFGWTYIDGIRTPYKEEIILSKIKIALDSPEQNQIEVQNYKTQFEDLFQRIAATTTSVQFSTGEYQRAAGVVEVDGTIEASAIQNSIINNSIILSNSNNESVIMDSAGITTTSLTSPNEMVRIVGGGIFLSNDFGTTWGIGLSGNGINANYINAGQLDTNLVRVMSGSFPTFRWDSMGISAYAFSMENGRPVNYTQSKFVRLDQYGLYGIQSDSFFNALEPDEDGIVGEQKIWEHSKFYLTWNGFGMRTDSGSVNITSDEDLVIKNGTGATLVKLGSFQDGNYGMRLFNEQGDITLETSNSGQLYLKDTIKIGPDIYTPRVILGASEGYDIDGNIVGLKDSALVYSKIFSAKNLDDEETLSIYDNGKLVANDLVANNAQISGTIQAGSFISDSVIIGGVGSDTTIGMIVSGYKENSEAINTMKGIKIVSDAGYTFKQDRAGTITPNFITLTAENNGVIITDTTKINWYLNSDLSGIVNNAYKVGTGASYVLTKEQAKEKFVNDKCFMLASYSHSDGKIYNTYVEIILNKDGAQGEPGESITYRIESSEGFTISENSAITSTTLTARIYQGATELDPSGQWSYTWYDKTDKETDFDINTDIIGTTKTITYDLTKFNDYSQIYFIADSGT